MFLCADLWKDACTLKSAYHDSAGVTEAFIRNGLHNALRTLGLSQESPDIAKWPYHVVVNPELQQVGPPACSHHTSPDSLPGVEVPAITVLVAWAYCRQAAGDLTMWGLGAWPGARGAGMACPSTGYQVDMAASCWAWC